MLGSKRFAAAVIADWSTLCRVSEYQRQKIAQQQVRCSLHFAASSNKYLLVAGINDLCRYLKDLFFSEQELAFLSEKAVFAGEYLGLLRDFEFTGQVLAVPEGALTVPGAPVLHLVATRLEAELLGQAALCALRSATAAATAASRYRIAAGSDYLIESGWGAVAGVAAATVLSKAAYLGGFDATTNLQAGHREGVPLGSTGNINPADLIARLQSTDPGIGEVVVSCDSLGVEAGLIDYLAGQASKGQCFTLAMPALLAAGAAEDVTRHFQDKGLSVPNIMAVGDISPHFIAEQRALGVPINSWAISQPLGDLNTEISCQYLLDREALLPPYPHRVAQADGRWAFWLTESRELELPPKEVSATYSKLGAELQVMPGAMIEHMSAGCLLGSPESLAESRSRVLAELENMPSHYRRLSTPEGIEIYYDKEAAAK